VIPLIKVFSKLASVRVGALVAATCIILIALPVACSQPDVRGLVFKYYLEALEASKSGIDVSEAVRLLNDALEKLESGDLADALSYVEKVPDSLSRARASFEEARRRTLLLASTLLALGLALAVVAYKRLPTLYARFMVWYLSQYRFRRVRGRRCSTLKSTIISEEVAAVLLAIIVVAGVFAISQVLMAGRVVEPFCALGTLGPHKKIGDYPSRVVVGEPVKLWIYVGNYMGYPAYFRVLVKLGDRSSVMSEKGFNAPLIASFERILAHNESTLIPLSFRVEREGTNLRHIVELWMYNETVGKFTFTNRWNQVLFNATRTG